MVFARNDFATMKDTPFAYRSKFIPCRDTLQVLQFDNLAFELRTTTLGRLNSTVSLRPQLILELWHDFT